MAAPLLRYANSVGADAGKLSGRGVLLNGELRSAQAQAAGPVWFVFTGAAKDAAIGGNCIPASRPLACMRMHAPY